MLIGDSGQQDPEIYHQIELDYPGRVRAIYIRDVSRRRRDATVRRIADEVASHGVDMLLVGSSQEAARHAAEIALIDDPADR